MTRVVTMGTFSCATIALAGFKGTNYEDNEAYRKGEFEHTIPAGRKSLRDFWDAVLMPISQPLGETAEYPFDMLMDEVDAGWGDYGPKSKLGGKFIIATLNSTQAAWQYGYWPARLAARGFALIDKTNNSSGETCYIYTRNNNRVE